MVKINYIPWANIKQSRLLNPKIGKHLSLSGSRVQSRFLGSISVLWKGTI